MYAREVLHDERLVWIEPSAVEKLTEMPRGTVVRLRSGEEVYVNGSIGQVQAALRYGDEYLDPQREFLLGLIRKHEEAGQ